MSKEGVSPFRSLLPSVLEVRVLGKFLVDVLERVLSAAAVDLSVGQSELLSRVLVLRLCEVAGHDPTSVVVGHFALRFVLRLVRFFELFDACLEGDDEFDEFVVLESRGHDVPFGLVRIVIDAHR